MKIPLGLIGCLFASVVMADDYTVQGSWAPAPASAEYAPQYHAQCQVDAVQVYENLTLTEASFSTSLTFNPGQVLECRSRNVNIVISSSPLVGNWSAWAAGVIAQQPADVSGFTLTIIHHQP